MAELIVNNSTRQGNWMVWNVDSIVLDISIPVKQYHQRKATLTLSGPNKLALPLCDGSGPQPEDTLTLIEVQDALRNAVKDIEEALKDKEAEAW